MEMKPTNLHQLLLFATFMHGLKLPKKHIESERHPKKRRERRRGGKKELFTSEESTNISMQKMSKQCYGLQCTE